MHELRFRAMGCEAHVVLTGTDAEARLHEVQAEIDALERKWSRFIDDSEVSRMNAKPGVPVLVSPETFMLIERATSAWEMTRGRFDPTVADALIGLGYDRTFKAIAARTAPVLAPRGAPGPSGIRIDPVVRTVTLPEGVHFDPGGIGKGLAADLVVTKMLGTGSAGAMVNLGGDLRAAGEPPTEHGWIVALEDPTDPSRHIARVTIVDGAVCTSSRLLRRWTRADGSEVHHLVDPKTGEPFETDVVSVTVVAGEAWWAEALTKAVFAGALEVVSNA
jgi:thiamine biosynthesis lipoprotein